MPLMYRSMTPDGDYPKVGPTARTLGVRVPPSEPSDITPDEDDNVAPESGGMSVAPRWQDLPRHRIPERLKDQVPNAVGKDVDRCWRLGEGAFESTAVNNDLYLRHDKPKHGLVEPAAVVALDTYQGHLAATRQQWVVDEE